MPDSTHSSTASQPTDGRLVRAARSGAALARRMVRGVAVVAGLSAGAGLLLWALLWWPPSDQLGPLLGAAVTLAVVLTPATVLGLFYVGLRDLVALPKRISTHASRTADASVETYRSAMQDTERRVGLLRRLLARIWALRTLLSDHRALLVRYATMTRFLTPAFLLLVVAALGLTVVFLFAASLGLIVVLF